MPAPPGIPDLDSDIAAFRDALWRFCLLLTRRPSAAESAAFQTFLYYGSGTAQTRGREHLFRWAYRACVDQLYRRGGRPLPRHRLADALDREIGDDLWSLMRAPLKRRAAAFLVRSLGMSGDEAAFALSTSQKKISRLAVDSTEAFDQLDELEPRADWAERLSDEIFLRFSERSVRFENRLLRIRSAADRAMPWIGLAIAAFCAAAVWYSSTQGE